MKEICHVELAGHDTLMTWMEPFGSLLTGAMACLLLPIVLSAELPSGFCGGGHRDTL